MFSEAELERLRRFPRQVKEPYGGVTLRDVPASPNRASACTVLRPRILDRSLESRVNRT
jgi:hypothetical protein